MESMNNEVRQELTFEEITKQLGGMSMPAMELSVLKRVIQATGDFDYKDSLVFANMPLFYAMSSIQSVAVFMTDVRAVLDGINKDMLCKMNCQAGCHEGEPLVAFMARSKGVSQAAAGLDCIVSLTDPLILAIGEDVEALGYARELIQSGKLRPAVLVAGAAGEGAKELKEELLTMPVPAIVFKGDMGGAAATAAVCNALLYLTDGKIV